jgi:hypothetical protein
MCIKRGVEEERRKKERRRIYEKKQDMRFMQGCPWTMSKPKLFNGFLILIRRKNVFITQIKGFRVKFF